MPLSAAGKRALETLVAMEADEKSIYAPEIVVEGLECYIGTKRFSLSTVRHLLRLLALTEVSDSGLERYTINSGGRALLARPEIAAEIEAAIASNQKFTVKDNRVVSLKEVPDVRD